MANKINMGKKYRFTWLVEKGKIRELIETIGDDNAIYRDEHIARRQGYDNIVSPPTFCIIPLHWTGVALQVVNDLKLKVDRMMHAEEGYEYFDEIYPGDILTGVLEIKGMTEKRGKTGILNFVELQTTFTNQHKKVVLKEEMLIVEKK